MTRLVKSLNHSLSVIVSCLSCKGFMENPSLVRVWGGGVEINGIFVIAALAEKSRWCHRKGEGLECFV